MILERRYMDVFMTLKLPYSVVLTSCAGWVKGFAISIVFYFKITKKTLDIVRQYLKINTRNITLRPFQFLLFTFLTLRKKNVPLSVIWNILYLTYEISNPTIQKHLSRSQFSLYVDRSQTPVISIKDRWMLEMRKQPWHRDRDGEPLVQDFIHLTVWISQL